MLIIKQKMYACVQSKGGSYTNWYQKDHSSKNNLNKGVIVNARLIYSASRIVNQYGTTSNIFLVIFEKQFLFLNAFYLINPSDSLSLSSRVPLRTDYIITNHHGDWFLAVRKVPRSNNVCAHKFNLNNFYMRGFSCDIFSASGLCPVLHVDNQNRKVLQSRNRCFFR